MAYVLPPPRERLIMHFTHLRHLDSMVADGMIYADALVSDRLRHEVGDRGIKANRRELLVTCGPGGHPCDYVPFYFAPRSPMLYRIAVGGVPHYQDGQDPLVLTGYYDQLDDLDREVDWPLQRAQMWKSTAEDPNRATRRAAEFEFSTGNLLESDADALVNTVNTVGVMGKGVALQFKQAFPANYRAYKAACDRGEVETGRMFVWDSGQLGARRYIINFPTKRHWRTKSRIEDISAGLDDLIRVINELAIDSIAIPALGCGNGGLAWQDVKPLIEATIGALDIRALVYPPGGAPAPRDMPVATTRPKMTYGRAALLVLVGSYARAAMRERFDLVRPGASLLEIQKLMYLLQAAGQPLRLSYTKGRYGPYAENLNKVLEVMAGHFIRGYGDRSRAVLALDPIEVFPEAESQAVGWLTGHPDVRRDVDRVLTLTDGWESAYGMELLATVLFAAEKDPKVLADPQLATAYVHSWNARKQATFPEQHVERAWQHLQAHDWLTSR